MPYPQQKMISNIFIYSSLPQLSGTILPYFCPLPLPVPSVSANFAFRKSVRVLCTRSYEIIQTDKFYLSFFYQ